MNNEINKMLLKEKINYDKLKNCFSYEFNETIKYLKERGVYDEKMENSYIC